MNTYEGIRLIALRDEVAFRARNNKESEDYALKKIQRWYSKTFSTALHIVEELDSTYLYETYWAQTYEDMSVEDLEFARKDALLTPEEKEEAQREEDARDAMEFENMELEREFAKEEALTLDKMGSNKSQPVVPNLGSMSPEVEMPFGGGTNIPPGISMSFLGDDEDLPDGDSFGLVTRPTRVNK